MEAFDSTISLLAVPLLLGSAGLDWQVTAFSLSLSAGVCVRWAYDSMGLSAPSSSPSPDLSGSGSSSMGSISRGEGFGIPRSWSTTSSKSRTSCSWLLLQGVFLLLAVAAASAGALFFYYFSGQASAGAVTASGVVPPFPLQIDWSSRLVQKLLTMATAGGLISYIFEGIAQNHASKHLLGRHERLLLFQATLCTLLDVYFRIKAVARKGGHQQNENTSDNVPQALPNVVATMMGASALLTIFLAPFAMVMMGGGGGGGAKSSYAPPQITNEASSGGDLRAPSSGSQQVAHLRHEGDFQQGNSRPTPSLTHTEAETATTASLATPSSDQGKPRQRGRGRSASPHTHKQQQQQQQQSLRQLSANLSEAPEERGAGSSSSSSSSSALLPQSSTDPLPPPRQSLKTSPSRRSLGSSYGGRRSSDSCCPPSLPFLSSLFFYTTVFLVLSFEYFVISAFIHRRQKEEPFAWAMLYIAMPTVESRVLACWFFLVILALFIAPDLHADVTRVLDNTAIAAAHLTVSQKHLAEQRATFGLGGSTPSYPVAPRTDADGGEPAEASTTDLSAASVGGGGLTTRATATAMRTPPSLVGLSLTSTPPSSPPPSLTSPSSTSSYYSFSHPSSSTLSHLQGLSSFGQAPVPPPTSAATVKYANLLLRKAFHVAAVLIFVPAVLFVSPESHDLLYLGSAAALQFLVMIEFARVMRIYPQGASSYIDSYMNRYRDNRDGFFIITHLYLLAGCALPVWLGSHYPTSRGAYAAWFDENALSPSLLLAGCLAIGVGDSAAALGGIFVTVIGRPLRWVDVLEQQVCCCRGRRAELKARFGAKTIQGTTLFAASVFAFSCAFFLSRCLSQCTWAPEPSFIAIGLALVASVLIALMVKNMKGTVLSTVTAFAFASAIFLSCCLLHCSWAPLPSLTAIFLTLVASVLIALLEAVVAGVDNAILPIYMYLAFKAIIAIESSGGGTPAGGDA